jgi:hypothetical protein
MKSRAAIARPSTPTEATATSRSIDNRGRVEARRRLILGRETGPDLVQGHRDAGSGAAADHDDLVWIMVQGRHGST